MVKRRLLILAAVSYGVLLMPAIASAANLRSERTVAGVRATLEAYDAAVIAGNGRAACPLMTEALQKRLAQLDHRPSCEAAITLAGEALKSEPKLATQLRSYVKTVKITVHGARATIADFNTRGHTAFSYTKGRWYISAS